jgi:pyruvate/2-oxoglutarate dehydrogenase complex dihydrolipoamide acyltransferase (E2) component
MLRVVAVALHAAATRTPHLPPQGWKNQLSRRLTVRTHNNTLGAQFPPSYHRPFLRYLDGEQGAGAPAEPAAPPAAPAAPPTPSPAPPAPAPQPAPPAPAAPQPIAYRGDPDEYVRELREEAKTHRLAAEKAAGEYATAQAERDAIAAERDNLARERALLLNAPKYGARPDLLLDSSSFMKTFADIDLADEAAVKKAIEDALERNSAFKATTLPGASGGGHQGGQPPTTTPTLEGAVRRHFGG